MMNPRAISVGFTVALVALSVALVQGCAGDGTVAGYSSKSIYDKSIHTIALPIFKNHTFYREYEFQLSEALVKDIEARTPYKVTRDTRADTQMTGTILSVDQRLLSRTLDSGVTQEAEVVVTVSFEWKDLRTGKIIRKRSRIQGAGQYVPTRGVSEPVEVGGHAAIAQLSREIVSVMAGDW